MKKKELTAAFKDTLPVMAGYLVLGIGFGMIMNSYGYGVLLSVSMSLFIYAGSMQYAAINLFTGGAGMLTVALTTLAVNARHLFYGISMVDSYKNTGAGKPYLIFALTDETYSLVCSGTKPVDYCYAVSILDHLYWVSGTAIGGLLGSALTINTKGIDFALTALFVTIFWEQWLSTKDHFAAITGLACSVISLFIFGSGSFLIPAMIGITAVLLLRMRKEDRDDA